VFGKNHGKCAYILEKIMGDRDSPPLFILQVNVRWLSWGIL